MIAIGSLFSGIGGLELGLGWALSEAGISHHVAWQVECEMFPRSVLARHWPEADRSVEDVCQAGQSNLVPVDVICGGFPCQDISLAGAGAGLAGERSGLWFQYLRVVCELRPHYIVVENVSALLGRGLGVVLAGLAESGYDAQWRCVRAQRAGGHDLSTEAGAKGRSLNPAWVEQLMGFPDGWTDGLPVPPKRRKNGKLRASRKRSRTERQG